MASLGTRQEGSRLRVLLLLGLPWRGGSGYRAQRPLFRRAAPQTFVPEAIVPGSRSSKALTSRSPGFHQQEPLLPQPLPHLLAQQPPEVARSGPLASQRSGKGHTWETFLPRSVGVWMAPLFPRTWPESQAASPGQTRWPVSRSRSGPTGQRYSGCQGRTTNAHLPLSSRVPGGGAPPTVSLRGPCLRGLPCLRANKRDVLMESTALERASPSSLAPRLQAEPWSSSLGNPPRSLVGGGAGSPRQSAAAGPRSRGCSHSWSCTLAVNQRLGRPRLQCRVVRKVLLACLGKMMVVLRKRRARGRGSRVSWLR